MPAPPLTPLAAAVLEVGAPESVLEVQCGEGDGALFLAREFPRARVRGVDSSADASLASAPRGLRLKFVRWQLSRHGIRPVSADLAGEGSFSVGRL
jgi:trans-aconitate methyltransferase